LHRSLLRTERVRVRFAQSDNNPSRPAHVFAAQIHARVSFLEYTEMLPTLSGKVHRSIPLEDVNP
jgi:hypothetical protein